MAQKNTNFTFTNLYGEKVSKERYVDEKMTILAQMRIVFPDYTTSTLVNMANKWYWIRRILLSCKSEISIDSLARMLTLCKLTPEEFIKVYWDRLELEEF